MGWLIAFAILVALAFFPLGFRAIYRKEDPGVWLLIGPFRFRVYPGRKKSGKKEGKSEKLGDASTKGASYENFGVVLRTILKFLEEFRRKIRVRNLELKLILAGDDPSDLAVNYGRAWAALGSLVPPLEQFLVIKKRNFEVECDFTAEETLIYARIDATITLFRTVHLLSKHGIKIIKDFIELKKLRKGGAQL